MTHYIDSIYASSPFIQWLCSLSPAWQAALTLAAITLGILIYKAVWIYSHIPINDDEAWEELLAEGWK